MKIPDECSKDTNVTFIKIEEGASKAIIFNPNRENFTVVQIDGCVVKNEIAADGAIYDKMDRVVIVELKGTDTTHGARQVTAAAHILQKSTKPPSAYAGLVVGKEFPRVTSSIQRVQNDFATKFKGPLHVVTKNYEFSYEAILSFRGPHKK